jgi:hypothetical protein
MSLAGQREGKHNTFKAPTPYSSCSWSMAVVFSLTGEDMADQLLDLPRDLGDGRLLTSMLIPLGTRGRSSNHLTRFVVDTDNHDQKHPGRQGKAPERRREKGKHPRAGYRVPPRWPAQHLFGRVAS